jgi:hypothetical protein
LLVSGLLGRVPALLEILGLGEAALRCILLGELVRVGALSACVSPLVP